MEKLYVCYATSDEYSGFTGISLLSLLTNNTDIEFVEIFILDYSISEINKTKLTEVANQFNTKITFVKAGQILESMRSNLGLEDFAGSLATYSRAFIGYLIPEYVDKLLYIDSDTIVCSSVKSITYVDMSNKVLAGAIGVNQYRYKGERPNPEIQMINGNSMYIACGILYYNLDNWRSMNCAEMIAKTCRTGMKFRFADQTLINNAIPDSLFGAIPPEFNYWGHCFPPKREKREMLRGGWHSTDAIDKMIANPIILHFKGLFYRPWFDGCISRKKDEYSKYKQASPWSDMPQTTLKDEINKRPSGERFHLKYSLLCERVPYNWMAIVLLKGKHCLGKVIKLLKKG